MVNQNTAYDLSFYEAEEERQVARKQTKESRLIKAERRYSITKKIADIVSVALVAGLLIAVIATNAAITDTTVKIATAREDIVQLESQRDYLNFTLESRMTLDEIESYAVFLLPAQAKFTVPHSMCLLTKSTLTRDKVLIPQQKSVPTAWRRAFTAHLTHRLQS